MSHVEQGIDVVFLSSQAGVGYAQAFQWEVLVDVSDFGDDGGHE